MMMHQADFLQHISAFRVHEILFGMSLNGGVVVLDQDFKKGLNQAHQSQSRSREVSSNNWFIMLKHDISYLRRWDKRIYIDGNKQDMKIGYVNGALEWNRDWMLGHQNKKLKWWERQYAKKYHLCLNHYASLRENKAMNHF